MIFVAGSASKLEGQSSSTTSVWPLKPDPALLARDRLPDFSIAWLGVDLLDGSFRRTQDPRDRKRVQLAMAGQQRRSDGGMYGRFSYAREFANDVRWSAVADPHDQNPYIWADSTGGDWIRDEVRVGVSQGFSRWRSLHLGWGVDGRYLQGARRNDPRPLVRLRDLQAVASGRWAHASTPMGARLEIQSVREENEIGYFAGDDPFVFRLRGASTFDRTQLVRAERSLTRSRLSGDAFLHRSIAGQWIEFGLGGEIRTDTIIQGVARPEGGGSLRRVGSRAWLTFLQEDDDGAAQLSLKGAFFRSTGNDPVFRSVNLIRNDWEIEIGQGDAMAQDLERLMAIPTHRVSSGASPNGLQWALQLRGISKEDIAAGHRTHWMNGSGTLGASHALASSSLLPATWVAIAVGARLPIQSGWEVDRPTAVTERIARPDFELDRAKAVSLNIEAVFGPGLNEQSSGRSPTVVVRWHTLETWGAGARDLHHSGRVRRQWISMVVSLKP